MSLGKSQFSNNNTAPNIEYLPPEIQLPILLNLESYKTLFNIIQASPLLLHVFRDQRRNILLAVTRNAYDPQVIPDVLTAAAVFRGRPELPKPDPKDFEEQTVGIPCKYRDNLNYDDNEEPDNVEAADEELTSGESLPVDENTADPGGASRNILEQGLHEEENKHSDVDAQEQQNALGEDQSEEIEDVIDDDNESWDDGYDSDYDDERRCWCKACCNRRTPARKLAERNDRQANEVAQEMAEAHLNNETGAILGPYWRLHHGSTNIAKEAPSWSLPLFEFSDTLEYFLQDFTQLKLSRFETYTHDPYISEDGGFHKAVDLSLMPLSSTEKGRIQRAFCRFEIFAQCFQTLPRHSNILRPWDRRERFFDGFSAQEVEEIVCVRDYFLSRLAGFFEDMEEEYLKRQASDDHKDHDSTLCSHEECKDRQVVNEEMSCGYPASCQIERHICTLGRSRDWPFLSPLSKANRHTDYIECLSSRGLSFLRKVFQAQGVERTHLIMSNIKSPESFITNALETYPDRHGNSANTEEYRADRQGQTLTFEGDNLSSKSMAFLWSDNFKPNWCYNSPRKPHIRDFAAVFWDEERLRVSGILNKT
jgi:hypothetical protein